MQNRLIVLGAFFMIFSFSAQAQKPAVFVKAGLNLANISINKDGDVENARRSASFHAGLQADLLLLIFLHCSRFVFLQAKDQSLSQEIHPVIPGSGRQPNHTMWRFLKCGNQTAIGK